MALLNFVHEVTIQLDATRAWLPHFQKRFVRQLLYAFFIPLLLDVFAVVFGCLVLARHCDVWGFIVLHAPIVLLWLALVNCYYVIHYLVYQKEDAIGEIEDLKTALYRPTNKNVTSTAEGITVLHESIAKYIPADDILYCYVAGHRVIIVTKYGQYSKRVALKEISNELSDDKFFTASRSLIVRMDIIKDYDYHNNKTPMKLIFKENYEEYLLADPKLFTIARDRRDEFKAAFHSRPDRKSNKRTIQEIKPDKK